MSSRPPGDARARRQDRTAAPDQEPDLHLHGLQPESMDEPLLGARVQQPRGMACAPPCRRRATRPELVVAATSAWTIRLERRATTAERRVPRIRGGRRRIRRAGARRKARESGSRAGPTLASAPPYAPEASIHSESSPKEAMGSLTTEAPGAGLSSRLLAFLYAHGRFPAPPVGPVYCECVFELPRSHPAPLSWSNWQTR